MTSRAWSNVPIGLAVVAGLLLSAGPAAAQAQNEKLQVQAFIGELCTVTSASLDFGQDIGLDGNTVASGAIDISCATETTFGVALDGGLHFSPFVSSRAMAGGGADLLYTLYKDAGRQTQWGVGETVPGPAGGTGTVPVYGRIPSQSNGHASGLHTDEVTITLVF